MGWRGGGGLNGTSGGVGWWWRELKGVLPWRAKGVLWREGPGPSEIVRLFFHCEQLSCLSITRCVMSTAEGKKSHLPVIVVLTHLPFHVYQLLQSEIKLSRWECS